MTNEKGLMIDMGTGSHPCIIKVGDQEIYLYLAENSQGRKKIRIIADKNEVQIIGPHRVRKIQEGVFIQRIME